MSILLTRKKAKGISLMLVLLLILSAMPLQVSAYDSLSTWLARVDSNLDYLDTAHNGYSTLTDSGSLAWTTAQILESNRRMYEITGDSKYLQYLSKYINNIKNSLADNNGDGYLGWGSDAYDPPDYHEYVVHDGVMMAQWAKFILLVRNDPSISSATNPQGITYGAQADDLASIIHTHLVPKWEFVWDDQLNVYMDDLKGTYTGANTLNHYECTLPYNQYLVYAQALYIMYLVDPQYGYYLFRAEKMFERFHNELRINGTGYNWWYWNRVVPYDVVTNLYPEDYSHATLDLYAAYESYMSGGIFDTSKMTRFANTMYDIMWNDSTTNPLLYKFVDNTYGTYAYSYNILYPWGDLSRFKSEIFPLFEKNVSLRWEISVDETKDGTAVYQLHPDQLSPQTFTLSSPSNGSTGVDTDAVLKWKPSVNAAHYALQVATDSNFTNLVVNRDNIIDISTVVKGLNPGTTYYWKVIAKNRNSSSIPYASSVYSFTTRSSIPHATPQSFSLMSPANSATKVDTKTVLKWSPSLNAADYSLKVSTHSDLSSPIVDKSGITAVSDVVEGLTPGTTYYWKVTARSATGETLNSSVYSFTVQDNPEPFYLMRPANGSVYCSSTVFEWWPSPDAVSYTLEVCKDVNFTTNVVIKQENITGTSYTGAGLPYNRTYYWRVTANSASGNKYTPKYYVYQPASSQVIPGSFSLSSPANGSTDTGTSPVLTWGASANATSYTLQVSTEKDFTTFAINQAGITGTSYTASGLSSGTTYYWRVIAKSATGGVYQPSTFTFSTGGTPPPTGWYSKQAYTEVHDLGTGNAGKVSVEFDVTPLYSASAGLIGYADTSTTITSYTSMSMILAMETAGYFDVRNGSIYDKLVTVNYTANTKYHVRMIADLDAQTYDVYITPDGGSETMIAQNYAYRTDAPAIDDLGKVCLQSQAGDDRFVIENHTVQVIPPPPAGWYSKQAYTEVHDLGTSNTGNLSVEFDVTPLYDASAGLIGYADTSTTITSYTSMSMILAMETAGYFDVRNGSIYDKLATVNYTANTKYHVRMVADLVAKTYDVYITPNGGSETMIAQNYAFRTDAPAIDDLGKVCLQSQAGDDRFKVENHTVNPVVENYTLDFWHRDSYSGGTAGYHFKQILIDDVVVWEQDVATDAANTWINASVDVTSYVSGKAQINLKCRVYDKDNVYNLPIDAYWDDITITNTAGVPNGGFESGNDWTYTENDVSFSGALSTTAHSGTYSYVISFPGSTPSSVGSYGAIVKQVTP